MAEQAQQAQTITIDGVSHNLADFSVEVQKLVSIRNVWEQEVVKAELEYARARAAVRDLDRELLEKLKAELAASAESGEAAPEAPAE